MSVKTPRSKHARPANSGRRKKASRERPGSDAQPRPSIRFAQNFLKDPELVASLVSKANLRGDDVVYEIGPGHGIITSELVKTCQEVKVIEIEKRLADSLREKFKHAPNLEIFNCDFLAFNLPESDYKVFSNIPFNITADVLRKLLNAPPPPSEAYLILQREAAEKYAGMPRETQVSVLLKPWFAFRILWRFQRTDFDPVPGVDVVLLAIERRDIPLVRADEAELYRRFVTVGFGAWKANLGKNFKKLLSHLQWTRLAQDLGFDKHAQPTQLTFDQWLGVFQFYISAVRAGHARLPLPSQ